MEAVTNLPIPRRITHTFTLDVQPGNRFTLDPRAAGYFRLGRRTNGAEALSETAPDGMNTVEQSQAPSPRRVSVKAWLGDSRDPSGTPDSDVFHFMGTAGDSVTVRLEADTQGGNNGGEATLRLMGPTARQVSGELPKRITAELDATGRYRDRHRASGAVRGTTLQRRIHPDGRIVAGEDPHPDPGQHGREITCGVIRLIIIADKLKKFGWTLGLGLGR